MELCHLVALLFSLFRFIPSVTVVIAPQIDALPLLYTLIVFAAFLVFMN